MARLIDADEAVERANASDEIVGSSIWETSEVVEFLEDCPTVDAVEVVRCKDCKSHNMCNFEQYQGLDGFCSYGERKGND